MSRSRFFLPFASVPFAPFPEKLTAPEKTRSMTHLKQSIF